MQATSIDLEIGRHARDLAIAEWGLLPIAPYLSALRPLEPESQLQRRFHVAQVEPQQENDVEKRLREDHRFDTFNPKEPKKVRVNPVRHRTVWRPMLVGYVFVGFDPSAENWQVIPQIRGVLRLLMVEMRPVPILGAVIDHIRQVEVERSSGRCAKRVAISIAVGTLVRILDPFCFAGLFGHVTKIDQDKQKVHVDVDIFGRATPLGLSPDQVEVI